MTTERLEISVEGVPVEIVRKRIKNVHLAVHPPDGRVRLSVPLHIDDEAARMAVVTRLPWIRRKQREIIDQARETEREMVSGESHYVDGRRHRLEVVKTEGPTGVKLVGTRTLQLKVHSQSSSAERLAQLERWYRRRLRTRASALIERWSRQLEVRVEDWRIRKMRTKWGSCSRSNGRIWLNLELAKKDDRCLEYVIVHELAHLLEPTHGDRHKGIISRHLPDWASRRDELNQGLLGFVDWSA